EISPLALHDALPISLPIQAAKRRSNASTGATSCQPLGSASSAPASATSSGSSVIAEGLVYVIGQPRRTLRATSACERTMRDHDRSEEHTSELQSLTH